MGPFPPSGYRDRLARPGPTESRPVSRSVPGLYLDRFIGPPPTVCPNTVALGEEVAPGHSKHHKEAPA